MADHCTTNTGSVWKSSHSDPARKLSANLYDIQGVTEGMCEISGEGSLG